MTASGAIWRNWGRSESVRPVRVERPSSPDAVRRAVEAAASSGLPIKAVGTGHSFSGVAVAPGVQLDLHDLTGLVSVDEQRGRATILAGTRLSEIPRLLAPYGLAMPNLGDIDVQTLSGAISTGTHGTGARFGGISAQVAGVGLVTGDGTLLRIDDTENAELLPAAALGLGALGVLVDVTLQCVPAFALRAVEHPIPLSPLIDSDPADEASLASRVAAADHFEFHWFPGTNTAVAKTNTRLPAEAPLLPLPRFTRWFDDVFLTNGVFRATCAAGTLVPAVVPRVNHVAERLMADREYTDRSHRVFATTRTVRFRELEYAVPPEAVPSALHELRDVIARRGWRISFPVEVRFAAADELWLSTASARPSGYIAVHRYHREDPADYFRAAEEIFVAHGGRPHWGKMHTRDAEYLRGVYPRFDEFLAVRDRLDPERLFTNPYLNRVLGP